MRKNSLGLTAIVPVTIYGLKVEKKKVNKYIYMDSVIELSTTELIKVVADEEANKAITKNGLLLHRCVSFDNAGFKSISQDKNGDPIFYKASEINIHNEAYNNLINDLVSEALLVKFKIEFPL